ncbi:MAG: redox-regulated ATPase YchF, partial [Thermoanaerobaculia bacterium]
MEVGIIGLPKVGKTTLFNILTASHQATDRYSTSTKTNVGVATVPDPRLNRLREHYQPKKFTPATVTYLDIPGLKKGGGSESLDLARLREVDALAHVVRAFEEPEILHSEGSVDPTRDVEIIDLELILADHEIVERRIARLDKGAKRGLSTDEKREQSLLAEVILPALEDERPLRSLDLSDEDERRLRGFQLLSAKPLLLVINVDEAVLVEGHAEDAAIEAPPGAQIVMVSAPIEEEISDLDAEHQVHFLVDLGLREPSLNRVIRASYDLLGLISFFTVGKDEVRAWTVRLGTAARQAGGAIHSDIERGFIRAEVVAWEDLLDLGSLTACKEKALLRLEGKEYL